MASADGAGAERTFQFRAHVPVVFGVSPCINGSILVVSNTRARVQARATDFVRYERACNGEDGQPPGEPPVNDGEGTSPGDPGH